MPEHDGRLLPAVLLPAAMGEDLDVALDFKDSLLILRPSPETVATRPGVSCKSLCVATGEEGMRFERLLRECCGCASEEETYFLEIGMRGSGFIYERSPNPLFVRRSVKPDSAHWAARSIC